MKKIVLLVMICLLVGCDSKKESTTQEKSYPVVTTSVTKKSVPIYLEYIGNIYSIYTASITPQVGGELIAAHVQQGQMVQAGDLLYTIDPRPYQADLEKTLATLERDKASLALAKNKVERYSELLPGDFISKLDFDELLTNVALYEAQIGVDEAEVDLAEIQLGYTEVSAPFTGMISQYDIDPGNIVTANDPSALTTLRQMDPIEVRFAVPQRDFIKIQKRMRENGTPLKAKIVMGENKESVAEGEVYFVDNSIDLNTGTILLKALVPNQELMLWPGEFVRTQVIMREEKNALLIPQAALQIGRKGHFVFVNEDGAAEVKYISIGRTYNGLVLVEKGLKGDEKIVVNGQVNLRPGVEVYEAKKTKRSS